MKILYIITQGENGGAQKNVLDMAAASAKEHEVYVATGQVKSEKDLWLHNELKKNGFESGQLHIFNNLIRNISPVHELKAFLEIYKYIKENKFDVVHLHSSKAGTLGSMAGKIASSKVVYTVHGFIFQEPMSIFKKVFYILAEFIASFFIDYHICVSRKDAYLGKKFLILRNPKKYAVIYNGITEDTSNLLNGDAARKYISEQTKSDVSEKVIFGSIANLYATKGLTYFIKAAKILKEKVGSKFVCTIFGEGELRDELEKQIKDSNLENEFYLLGYAKNASQYLKGLEVFVMSSIKEGLPYALVEASRAELPIIATNVGGIPEMSQYLKINLTEAKNPEQLANAMQNLLDTQNRLENKSKFNQIFSLENMTSKTLEVYKKVTG